MVRSIRNSSCHVVDIRLEGHLQVISLREFLMSYYKGEGAVLRNTSGGYTHLGFGALRRVHGLGLVKLRFHITLGDAVTQ